MLCGILYAEGRRCKERMLPVRVTLATEDLSTTQREGWGGTERNKAKMSSARVNRPTSSVYYGVGYIIWCGVNFRGFNWWLVFFIRTDIPIKLNMCGELANKNRLALKISHFPSLSVLTLPKPKYWLARASFIGGVFSSKDTMSTLEQSVDYWTNTEGNCLVRDSNGCLVKTWRRKKSHMVDEMRCLCTKNLVGLGKRYLSK